MSQILEKEPPPSPPPERVFAPPSTPDHPNAPKLEIGGSEIAHTVDSRTTANDAVAFPPSSPFDPTLDPSSSPRSWRRKSRKKGASREERVIKRFKPALVLENSGSVARDHLASERTFLAYVRTSLVIASTGVALVQLFAIASTSSAATNGFAVRRIQKFAHPLGATLVIFGLFVLMIGVYRYFVIQNALTKGVFPAARSAVGGITIILCVIIIIVFAVLISGKG
ncbi:hypothetical protein BDZ94DRAFT_1214909 [Collybia nuda]|uniref:DUF202 domain-containing protein n=1 Tax=Collybia nuda TaxID=64659 RepID=A0A9P6CKI0_9AGAR|nr:hypothetical protein BDZ94DRAFT_1214909 [Collybia nuda]